jgi:serine/threonine protein kinase
VKNYGRAIATAIEHLRDLKLVHRDIKPENLMFRKGSDEPVLVDFGLVRDLSETSLTQSWFPRGPGTPFYSSPEQLNNDKALIDWRSDQFSLGVMLGLLLTGTHPFERPGANVHDTLTAVADRKECSLEFMQFAQTKLPILIKMVAPWPIQRVQSPRALIQSLS